MMSKDSDRDDVKMDGPMFGDIVRVDERMIDKI